MRGFTTVRDLGGPAFGLKRAIDEGVVVGPAHLSQWRRHYGHQRPRRFPPAVRFAAQDRQCADSRMEQLGASVVADSPDEVRVRVREQLMLGATQIKLTGGGGVASPHSPLDVDHLHRARAARRRRGGGQLGDLCHRACLHARVHPTRDRGRREVHRARASDGRTDGQADGRARHLAEHSAVSR